MTLNKILRRLHALGHAPEFPMLTEDFFGWVMEDLGGDLIARYQRFHGLAITGKPDLATIEHLEAPRCAHPDVMPLAGVSSWSLRSLSYYQSIAYPGVDPAEIAADYAEAVRRIEASCGIAIAPASSPAAAQVVAGSGPIDGPWNVLALSELPPPDAGPGTVLSQTFDATETGLSRDQRVAMMCHEFMHCLGLGHATPGSGNLMEPVLSTIGSPQANWDIPQLQARYGPPGAPVPTAPPPPPSPATTTVTPGGHVGTADTFTIAVPAAGTYGYNFTFEKPGDYLLVIAPKP